MKKNVALICTGLILGALMICFSTHIAGAIGAPFFYASLLCAFSIFGAGVALVILSKYPEKQANIIMLIIASIGLAFSVAGMRFHGPLLTTISAAVNCVPLAYAAIRFARRQQKRDVSFQKALEDGPGTNEK